MAKDILMTIDNDLLFENGDFLVLDSGDQHIHHIIVANQGQFYQSPLLGVGIKKKENGPFDRIDLVRVIRENLQGDKFNVRRIGVTRNTDAIELDIDAVLKDNTAI